MRSSILAQGFSITFSLLNGCKGLGQFSSLGSNLDQYLFFLLGITFNRIHKVGDEVSGLTVAGITSESVEFKYFELSHTITLVDKKDY